MTWRAMRIALVLDQFDPARGGIEQWTAALAHALADRGHEVHVVARRFAAEVESNRWACWPVAARRAGLEFAEAVLPVLVELAPDVIHDMGFGWYCDVLQPHGGVRAAVAERKTAHWPGWLRGLQRAAARFSPRHRRLERLSAAQYADHGQTFVAVSNMVAADIERFHGVPRDRIRVIPNGVDSARFAPTGSPHRRRMLRRALGIADGTIVALCVAHNFRLKGVGTLIEAVARLRRHDVPVHALVVGGRRLQRWRRRADRLGIGRHITFVGAQPDTAPYYAAADLYVHPTLYDSCSLVLLEAAAAGLPLITTRCNGAAELFRDGSEQLLVDDPRSAVELGEAIRSLAPSEARRRMGEAARQRAVELSSERNVDAIVSLYREIVARRGPRREAPAEALPSVAAVGAAPRLAPSVVGARG